MTWACRWEFKLQDFWIGVFWKRGRIEPDIWTVDVWICLVPCLPLHVLIGGYDHG